MEQATTIKPKKQKKLVKMNKKKIVIIFLIISSLISGTVVWIVLATRPTPRPFPSGMQRSTSGSALYQEATKLEDEEQMIIYWDTGGKDADSEYIIYGDEDEKDSDLAGAWSTWLKEHKVDDTTVYHVRSSQGEQMSNRMGDFWVEYAFAEAEASQGTPPTTGTRFLQHALQGHSEYDWTSQPGENENDEYWNVEVTVNFDGDANQENDKSKWDAEIDFLQDDIVTGGVSSTNWWYLTGNSDNDIHGFDLGLIVNGYIREGILGDVFDDVFKNYQSLQWPN